MLALRTFPTTIVCLLLGLMAGKVAAEEHVDRWECAAYLRTVTEHDGKKNGETGSGFVLRHEGCDYLVTAEHLASTTNGDTELSITVAGRTAKLPLRDVGFSEKNKWRTKANYDLAVLPVKHELISAATGWDAARSLREGAPRKLELEIVGFPFGLGASEEAGLQPIVVEGRIASGEMTDPFKPKMERVVLCMPPCADGTSGGPVFGRSNEGPWQLAGMFVGNLMDRSGAKLSKIVPARAVLELVEQIEREEGAKDSTALVPTTAQ